MAVGKTNIALRFVSETFEESHRATFGASFTSKSIKIDSEIIQFQIWDTAGQEKFRSMMPQYYRGAAAAIVVYDITSEESFRYMKSWVKELNKLGPEKLILAVAGNKCDLKEQRQVSYNAGKSYADEVKAIFMETSAKTGENVEDLFIEIGTALPSELANLPKQTLQIRDWEERSVRRKSCCRS